MTTAFKTEYIVDLSTTLDEIEAALPASVDTATWEQCGFRFKPDGSINVRSTVYNLLKAVTSNSLKIGGSRDSIVGLAFHYDVDFEPRQVSCALASLARDERVYFDKVDGLWYLGQPEYRNW